MSGANRRGLSVGTKLTAATVVLIAAALGGSAYYSYRTLNDQAASAAEAQRLAGEAAMRRQSQLQVRSIASASAVLLAGGDFQSLKEQVASSLSENPDIVWLAVSYEHGGSSQVVAASEMAPFKEGQPLDDPLAAELRARPRSPEIAQRVGDEPHVSIVGANVVADLPDGERAVGQVLLAQSRQELEEALTAQLATARRQARASARRQLIAAGVLLVLGILLGTFQGLRITRPIKALNVQAGAIAAGDFNRRVEVSSRDEIGQLAASFNSMAESLGTVLDEMAAKVSLERELELARSVQELMSPPPSLHSPGPFRVAGMCELADSCGGDWWSYRLLSENRLLLVVGDVTGHGMPAAMIAATARGAVEALTHRDDDSLTALEVLEAIDRAIRDVGKQELMMTCFALIVDARTNRVTFANAGHCFPYVLRPDDDGRLRKPGVLAVRGNPLGNETKVIREGERELAPGDVLVLTTDGLTDRISGGGDRFGERRLRELMVSYPMGSDGDRVLALRDAIADELQAFAAGHPADDDITLVVCQLLDRETARVAQQGAA